MRSRRVFLGLIIILILCSLLSLAVSKRVINPSIKLSLKITTASQGYILGEIVPLNFEIINEESKEISLPGELAMDGESLRVYIADDIGTFKEYLGPRSGFQIDGLYNDIKLKPKESFKSQTPILWNSKPPTEYKGEVFAQNLIETDYAMPKSGVYFVKAVLDIPGEVPSQIESEPIQILLNNPVGDELKIWNRIKENGEFAHFMQTGNCKISKTEEREKLLKEVQQIITKYPSSLLVSQMKQSIEKFQANEERRKASL